MEQVFHTLESEFKGKIAFINIDVNNPDEQQLCSRYKIQYIPTTYFMNSKGETVYNYVGVIPTEEMRTKLNDLLEDR